VRVQVSILTRQRAEADGKKECWRAYVDQRRGWR
jgi:hypothetical protein